MRDPARHSRVSFVSAMMVNLHSIEKGLLRLLADFADKRNVITYCIAQQAGA